jgi:uncharacterized protein (DUF2141 family)
LALLCGLWASLDAAGGATVTLLVQVDGFESAEGMAGIALWGGPRGFPEEIDHAAAATYVEIADGVATVQFDEVVSGDLAVTVYHDRNDNRRFDKNWLGMPTEAWGVSNNARPRLRAPRFDEAVLRLETGEHVVRISVD